MSLKILKSLMLFTVLFLMIGCSADRAQLISHPAAAKPGDTISVIFSDVYIIVSDTSVSRQAYTRDSLHAVFGLPAGWTVLSADYYVTSGLKVNSLMNITTDATLLEKLLADSLATYMARKSPMAPDDSWKKYFANKTLTAHGFALDSIPVDVNTVDQWLSYAAKIGFSFPAGTKMDTSIAVDSLPIDTNSIPAIAKFLFGNVKNVWFKTVPIVCFARVIVGQTEKDFNCYYYTKTGAYPSSGTSLVPNFDKGDMTFATININKANAVVQLPGRREVKSVLHVSAVPGAKTLIEIGAQNGELSIFDMAGKTVKNFGPVGGNNAAILWDRTTSSGAVVKSGTYVVRLNAKTGSASQAIQIMK